MSDTTEDRATEVKPPRENILRAVRPGVEFRAGEDGADPTLYGHFAVFNQWTEIDSLWEGQFLERIAPGAFTKTFAENRDSMQVLFQHGHDPVVGDKPLGAIRQLNEDKTGAYYEVSILDAPYVRDNVLPGLEADLYGASFRFRVMREEIVEKPESSGYNPRALPERTIKEAQVMEFGPVTFPAYGGATAGVRSLTDEFILERFGREPDRLRLLLNLPAAGNEGDGEEDIAPTDDRAGKRHPVIVRRDRTLYVTQKEEPTWHL